MVELSEPSKMTKEPHVRNIQRFGEIYEIGRIRQLSRADLAKIKKLLKDKAGTYTEEEFEKYLSHFGSVGQRRIRRIRRQLEEV